MLSVPPGLKIYIATSPLDMRKSFDGMAAVISKKLQHDVFSGHVYVFFNKRRNRIKLMYWDRNGYCCWFKRLERGAFRLPQVSGDSYAVNPTELGLILEGIELTARQRLQSC